MTPPHADIISFREKPPEKKYWFPAKTYGWGRRPPGCWQGWVVTAIWLILQVGLFLWFKAGLASDRTGLQAGTAILAIGLIAICWWKGEPPAWRWGKKSDENPRNDLK